MTQEIERLRQRIEELEDEERRKIAAWAKLTPEQKVATRLHQRFCHSNHTDHCGWEYESWDKPGYARKQYLGMAQKWLSVEPDAEKLVRLLEIR